MKMVTRAELLTPCLEAGHRRHYLNNHLIYAVISPRAGGLSIGINLTPDLRCNFNCVYCEVARPEKPPTSALDLSLLTKELEHLLQLAHDDQLFSHSIPTNLRQLHQVALSGDGEPTLCPEFAQVVHLVTSFRAQRRFPYYKITLITNGTELHRPEVQTGLKLFTSQDEVWIKLDAGSLPYLKLVNQPDSSFSWNQLMQNIIRLGRQRPIILQSLFPNYHHRFPSSEEIESYLDCLNFLKGEGAQIQLIQVYSAARPSRHHHCQHLPLKTLSHIAQEIRRQTGLTAQVF